MRAMMRLRGARYQRHKKGLPHVFVEQARFRAHSIEEPLRAAPRKTLRSLAGTFQRESPLDIGIPDRIQSHLHVHGDRKPCI